jgi:hypothetical protein
MSSPTSVIISVIIVIVVIAGSFLFAKNIAVSIDNEKIKVSGLYGKTIEISKVETVELLDTFPLVGIRINGIGLGIINIGIYTYSGYGTIRLFQNSHEKPYLFIKTSDGNLIIALGKQKNSEIFEKLKALGK